MGIATLELLAKKDSSSSEGSDFCRICHCGSEVEELISPCHCSGSLGFIHQTCLQEWLGITNKKVCELCRYEFKLHATLRPLSKSSCRTNSVQVCCGQFIRIILFVLNFIFWAASTVILGVGISVKFSLMELDDVKVSHDILNTSAIFLISLGSIVFVVGLLGCLGSLHQNRCILLLYFTLVTLIFLGEIALAIAVYVNKDEVTDSIKDQFKDCMKKYGRNGRNETRHLCRDTVDSIQSVLKCCGEMNATEWKVQSPKNFTTGPPTSCCKDPDGKPCTYDGAFSDGCYPTINFYVNKNAKFIGFGVLGVAIIELLGMSLACYLRVFIIKRTQYEQPHAA